MDKQYHVFIPLHLPFLSSIKFSVILITNISINLVFTYFFLFSFNYVYPQIPLAVICIFPSYIVLISLYFSLLYVDFHFLFYFSFLSFIVLILSLLRQIKILSNAFSLLLYSSLLFFPITYQEKIFLNNFLVLLGPSLPGGSALVYRFLL